MGSEVKSGDAAEFWPSCALSSTRRTARMMTQMYDGYLSEHGIEAAQFALLMMIGKAGAMGQGAMGRALGMDKTTLSRNLKVLRERRWVESITGEDARERKVALTKDGRKRLEAARPAWRRAQAALREGMSDREWESMWSSLRAVIRAVESAAEKSAAK